MKKLSKIIGIVGVLAMLSSLLVVATPASAGTLAWGNASGMPSTSTTNNEIRATSDVSDIAVAGDSSVIWVVDSQSFNAYVSTNGGKVWTQKVPATTLVTAPTAVAIAPDDPNFVVIAGGAQVAVSTNGGTSFTLLAGHTAATINDVAVSPTSSGVHYIAVAGATGGGAAVLDYFNFGATIPAWTSAGAVPTGGWVVTALAGTAAIQTIAFSPAFASDLIVTVVSTSAGATFFEIASFSSKVWNSALGFTDYNGVANVLGTGVATGAEISLYPTYLGADDQERRAFVAVAGLTPGVGSGGLYRMTDATPSSIATNTITSARSVAYDGINLIVGASASNAVWRSADPTAGSPVISSTNIFQRPGGQNNVVVAWDGATAVAGTSGNESAFAVSNDNGVSFNDISLIDTALTNITDFQQTADGSVRLMITNDAGDFSIWKKVSRWERIYSQIAPVVTPDIVRMAPGGTHLYVADLGGQTLLYSNTGGETSWSIRSLPAVPVDLAVESNEIVYLLAANGNVYKTTNAGFIWGPPRNTGLGNGATIISLGTDNLLVGGTGGGVAWSTDGNASSTTWTNSSVTGFTGTVQVAASGLANGDFIYAGDGATGNIRRREVGTTSWTLIISAATNGVSGLVLSDGVLYAISTDGATTSSLHRNISPSTSTSSTVWDAVADAGVVANNPPSSLTVTRTNGTQDLWVVDTAAAPDVVRHFGDTLYAAVPVQTQPADTQIIELNPITGLAHQVVLSWQRPSTATAYQLQIAFNEGMTELVTGTIAVTSSASTVVQTVGPANPAAPVQLDNGRTYFWRVRATTPVATPWSPARSFTIDDAEPITQPFEVESPARGANNVSITPLLTWSPFEGALRYELALSEDPSFAIVEWVRNVNGNFYAIEEELKYGTTYYWRVRAVTSDAPAATSDWANGVFQTMPEPTVAPTTPPPATQTVIITTQAPPSVVEVPISTPAPIPAYLLWMVIVIGAILVIALIVLIVRTRRVA